MEEQILTFAKMFASKGFYVFPLYGSGKGPQKPYGWALNTPDAEVKASKIIPATNNPDVVDTWPELVKTGYNSTVVAYGILGVERPIFDLDNKNGKNGSSQFKLLREKYKIPPPSMVCKSKSGGYHLFYAKPDKVSNVGIKSAADIAIAGTKYVGVDVRGDGGMVIGPTCMGPEAEWTIGNYQLILGEPGVQLSTLPMEIVNSLVKSGYSNDAVDAMVGSYEPAENDELSILKRGEIPETLSKGNRNNGIYLYLNALKNKNFTAETARKYVQNLLDVTEGQEDLAESVNVDDMIARIWKINLNSPYDMCRDLIETGLYRLTSFRSKLMYVILNPNPYIESRDAHDIASMKQLMSKFTRKVTNVEGKSKVVNPAELIDANIPPDREVATIGFKPGASEVFTLTESDGGKKYLNTWSDPRQYIRDGAIDDSVWDEFMFLVSRIYGPEGTDEYQLGLDLPAWLIQKPGIKPVVSPFIMSRRRGVGKSLYFNVLQNTFGYTRDGDIQARPHKVDEITGRFFNPNGATLLMFDEVQFPVHRDMRKESAGFWKHLKSLVTQETIPVEPKGGNIIIMPNLAGIMMAGNTGNNFPIEEFDRRIWLIDNDPIELVPGLVDRFFMMSKNIIGKEEKRKIINSLLFHINRHKIKLPLDRMRAPMNELKKEMMMSSMTDLEEWWITHFDNTDNLLATTPMLNKSAIMYLIGTSERLVNTRWKDDVEGTFRELKRRGMFHPVRAQNNNYLTRQVRGLPEIKPDGSIQQVSTEFRDVLYTTRQHGDFNHENNETVIQMYIQNVNSVSKWRKNKIENRKNLITNSMQ